MERKLKKLNTFLSVAELTALHQQSRLFHWGHIKFSLWKKLGILLTPFFFVFHWCETVNPWIALLYGGALRFSSIVSIKQRIFSQGVGPRFEPVSNLAAGRHANHLATPLRSASLFCRRKDVKCKGT
jgi:hypothetical protein